MLFIYFAGLFALAGCAPSNSSAPLPGLLFEALHANPIRTYFSDPRPEAAPQDRFAARDRMLELIHGSRREIRMWAYGLEEPAVIAALASASRRGVRVAITGSPDRSYAALDEAFRRESLPLEFSIRRRSGLQHIKLAVFDQSVAFTGTGNFTRSGFLFNHNAFLEIKITAAHRAEWRRLLAHLEGDEGAAKHRFLDPTTRAAHRTPAFRLAPGVRALLSPGDGRLIQTRLVQAIRTAQRELRFLIFSFTDPVIAAALAERARDGLPWEGIVDDPGNKGELNLESAAGRLNQALGFAPARLYLDGNRRVFAENSIFHGGHLHHKTLLVDDDRVLTGSYNWSLSARDRNLELFLMIEDAAVAASFRGEFERVRRNAVLQGRPPFHSGSSPDPASQASLMIEEEAGRKICVPRNLRNNELTVFAGQGPYFRAYHFPIRVFAQANQQAVEHQVCADLESLSRSSTGINTGRRYLLSPRRLQAIAPHNPIAAVNRPCTAAGDCSPLELYRVDLDEGWLWIQASGEQTNATANFRALRLWNRGGFQPAGLQAADIPELRLIPTGAPGFYRFTPPADAGSDALLFLNAPGGQTAIACVRYGSQLEPALREFLAAFAWEHGRSPACMRGE